MSVAPAPREADVAVRVRGLVRRFGATIAVDGISFDVRRGEMFVLIGPDGAGKTTTLRAVLGLVRPDAGELEVAGFDPWRRQRAIAARAGYLSQRFSLYGDLSVDENIEFFAAVHGVSGWKRRRDELLDLLRMTPFRARLADRLSGGMKQKLALAATLIHTPELLVLDEPTTGVDPVSRRDFWKILAALQRDGLTILLATPYLDEAERCARVALVAGGRVLALDEPAALRRLAGLALVELLAAPRREALALLERHPAVGGVQQFGERLHVELAPAAAAAPDEAARVLAAALVAGGCTVESAAPVEPSLEDVFIARIRAAEATAPEVRP